jgi:uncharacterized membrane protein
LARRKRKRGGVAFYESIADTSLGHALSSCDVAFARGKPIRNILAAANDGARQVAARVKPMLWLVTGAAPNVRTSTVHAQHLVALSCAGFVCLCVVVVVVIFFVYQVIIIAFVTALAAILVWSVVAGVQALVIVSAKAGVGCIVWIKCRRAMCLMHGVWRAGKGLCVRRAS